MEAAGVAGEQVLLLLEDHHLVSSDILETINSLLMAGEVTYIVCLILQLYMYDNDNLYSYKKDILQMMAKSKQQCHNLRKPVVLLRIAIFFQII